LLAWLAWIISVPASTVDSSAPRWVSWIRTLPLDWKSRVPVPPALFCYYLLQAKGHICQAQGNFCHSFNIYIFQHLLASAIAIIFALALQRVS
jgi:hypothetical protein